MRSLALIASLALAFGAALIGTRFPPGEWHAALAKPYWNPPNWLFGPVWTALYAGMAIAAWRIWCRGRSGPALVLYCLQLALNAAWSWLFFGLHRPDLAFAEIVVLWVAILATTVAFFRKDAHRAMAAAVLCHDPHPCLWRQRAGSSGGARQRNDPLA